MDLIDRKAAVSRVSDLLILELKGARIPTWNEVYNAIGDIPAVPAVPLDKLCELLATNADCPPEHNPIIDHCIENKCAECWKTVLKEWMEGLDAAD